jgi:hypothetical protein
MPIRIGAVFQRVPALTALHQRRLVKSFFDVAQQRCYRCKIGCNFVEDPAARNEGFAGMVLTWHFHAEEFSTSLRRNAMGGSEGLQD